MKISNIYTHIIWPKKLVVVLFIFVYFELRLTKPKKVPRENRMGVWNGAFIQSANFNYWMCHCLPSHCFVLFCLFSGSLGRETENGKGKRIGNGMIKSKNVCVLCFVIMQWNHWQLSIFVNTKMNAVNRMMQNIQNMPKLQQKSSGKIENIGNHFKNPTKLR